MSNTPISAQKVAEYLIYLDQETNKKSANERENWEPITNLKLQKLLYYCQAYQLVEKSSSLFSESIVAWKYGPVVHEVYLKFFNFRGEPFIKIYPKIEHVTLSQNHTLDQEIKSNIQKVYNNFKRYNGYDLVRSTHQERPWQYTFNYIGEKSVIPNSLIQEYFSEK